MPDFPTCKYCDMPLPASYEEHMGMYCADSPTGLHVYPDDSHAADIPEHPPLDEEYQSINRLKRAVESPLERFIALIAQGNLIREEPQTGTVPLLRRAEVVAQLYQAQALQRIAGELTVIRESLKGLPDALGAIDGILLGVEAMGDTLVTISLEGIPHD